MESVAEWITDKKALELVNSVLKLWDKDVWEDIEKLSTENDSLYDWIQEHKKH